MDIGVVLACAGRGVRLKQRTAKAFVKVFGRPLYGWSLDLFSGIRSIAHIVVVADRTYHPLIRRYKCEKPLTVIEGGRRRQDSVYNGVRVLPKNIDKVIVHDGARPLLSGKTVKELIKALSLYDSVTCGLPVKEALKKENRGLIRKTVQREHLWFIQTPQAFDRKLLTRAFDKFRRHTVYDETQLMELMKVKTKLIEGDPCNIKITYPRDLKMAELLLCRSRV